MEIELSLQLLRVVEQAAIACARTMGLGDRHGSDQVAVETMRQMMDQVAMDGTIVIGEGERDEAPMLFIGEKVGAGAKRPELQLPRRGHRRGPARGHQPVRDRRAQRHHRAGRQRKGRPAARPGLVHGKDRRRPDLQGRGGPGRAGRRQHSRHRPPAGARQGRSGRRGAGPSAPPETHRRHSRHRRTHPADRRRRPVGRHLGGGAGHGRSRRDGQRRRAGRRAVRGGAALPERRDPGAAGGLETGARGAPEQDGHHRPQAACTRPKTWRPASRSSLPAAE